MKRLALLLPLAMSVSLVGCYPWVQNDVPADVPTGAMMDDDRGGTMMDDDDDRMMGSGSSMMDGRGMMDRDDDDTAKTVTGRYEAYVPAVLTNGETKVLFFHAAWCPTCRAADTGLTAWYGAGPLPLSVYKVNFDTETELKSRYGVTYQHTFVLVDGQGNALQTLQGPSDAELQALLQA